MTIKIADVQTSSEPQVETKTVQFEGKIPALDKLTETAPATQVEEQTTTETQNEPAAEEKGIRKMTDEEPAAEPEAEAKPEATSETQTEPVAETPVEEDEDIDLNEIVVEVDGQERVVSEVLTELQTQLQTAKVAQERVAEIEKDAFLKGFIDHYLATGNANAYLEAKGVDYDKKGDLEILKQKFDKDHADFNEKQRELLWKKELKDKYSVTADLTEEDKQSEEYQIAQALLERDARNARKAFKDEQAKFQIAERKVEEKPAAQPQFDPQEYKQKLLAVKEVEAFTKNKLLKLGVTDEAGNAFGFEPSNPDGIIEMMIDDRKFWGQFAPNGKADYNKLMKMYAFSQDPDGYDKQLVEFGKDLGLQERLKEVKNTDSRLNKQTSGAQTKPQSESEAILQAMLKAKR